MKKRSDQASRSIVFIKVLILISAVIFLLYPIIALAQGPALPCRFHGTVQLDNATVPDDTIITAIIGADTYTTSTPSVYGNSTYAITIVPPGNVTYTDGTPVTFLIGDHYAMETGTWETGLNLVLNLTASSTAIPTPSPTPSETPTPTITPLPTTTPSPTPGPTLTPTPGPTPTPTPAPKAPLNVGRIIGLTIFGIIDILLIGALAYLVWRFFIRR
jgi:hypothetical protein